MSWHFSQALEAEFSAVFCWDGAQLEQWKSAPFARDDSCSDKMNGISHLSPFGTMYVPSTDALGVELLTSYLEGFRVKTLARQVTAQDLTAAEVACGGNTPESLVKSSPVTSSLKTAHSCELAALSESSKTLPPSGTMRSGWCSPRKRSVPTTYVSGCGLSLPTPRSTDGDRGGRGDLLQAVRGNKNSHFKSVPTPLSVPQSEASHRQVSGRWRAKMTAITGGGPLNPLWIEWLMGWPMGWTDFEPLETGKFQQWLQLHGISCLPQSRKDDDKPPIP